MQKPLEFLESLKAECQMNLEQRQRAVEHYKEKIQEIEQTIAKIKRGSK